MDINDPFSTALQAIHKELENIGQRASEIAGFSTSENAPSAGSLAESLIDINRSEQAVVTNLTVIKKLTELEDEVLRLNTVA
ncbi:MAG: hypothetical protein KDD70_08140 [Bdellovibrionales bacterium]|nr:hypothetical protein [Bdellovibrionales bacterium]